MRRHGNKFQKKEQVKAPEEELNEGAISLIKSSRYFKGSQRTWGGNGWLEWEHREIEETVPFIITSQRVKCIRR